MAQTPEEHERAAAGQDYDEGDPMGEGTTSFGSKILGDGPEALLEEIENLLPESWREQIRQFPVAAVLVGVGVGVWLGLKKGDEVLAAGSSMVSAAALANVSQVMDRLKQQG